MKDYLTKLFKKYKKFYVIEDSLKHQETLIRGTINNELNESFISSNTDHSLINIPIAKKDDEMIVKYINNIRKLKMMLYLIQTK